MGLEGEGNAHTCVVSSVAGDRENRGSSREDQVVTGWWWRETNARRIDDARQSTKRTAGMTERNERVNERERNGCTVLPPP